MEQHVGLRIRFHDPGVHDRFVAALKSVRGDLAALDQAFAGSPRPPAGWPGDHYASIREDDGQLQLHYLMDGVALDLVSDTVRWLHAQNADAQARVECAEWCDAETGPFALELSMHDGQLRTRACDPLGHSALHKRVIEALCSESDPSWLVQARALIAAGEAIDEPDADGNAPLALVLQWGRFDAVAQALLDGLLTAGADVNRRNHAGETPLLQLLRTRAAQPGEGRLKMAWLRRLLDAGARTDAVDLHGHTALITAVHAEDPPPLRLACVRELLRRGADPDVVTQACRETDSGRRHLTATALDGLWVEDGSLTLTSELLSRVSWQTFVASTLYLEGMRGRPGLSAAQLLRALDASGIAPDKKALFVARLRAEDASLA